MRVLAFGQMMTAAGERGAVFILADIDVAHDLFDGVFVDDRAHVDFWIGAVANTQCFGPFNQFLCELLVHFLVHDQPRRSRTALAGSPERAPDSAFNRVVDVGVVHDDDRVLAAHLERADRVAFRACGSNHLARFSRAGDGNQSQGWMAGHARAND